jgi:predicted chitinase
VARVCGLPLVVDPDLLLNPLQALQASIAWWEQGVKDETLDDPEKVTRQVNGGLLGLDHRVVLYRKAGEALA